MENKLLIFIILLTPVILSPARTRGRHLNRFAKKLSYNPNHFSPYIDPDIENHLENIDPIFLKETNIIDTLRHTKISGLGSIKQFIGNKTYAYYMPENYDCLADNSQWQAQSEKTANQLSTVVCLLADLHNPQYP